MNIFNFFNNHLDFKKYLSIIIRDGSGQEILETRQDETDTKSWKFFGTRQDKALRQKYGFKTKQDSKDAYRDKSRLLSSLKFDFKTSRDIQIFENLETRRDKTAFLVLSWPGNRDKTEFSGLNGPYLGQKW